MSTIANAKLQHNYKCLNGNFLGCIRRRKSIRICQPFRKEVVIHSVGIIILRHYIVF